MSVSKAGRTGPACPIWTTCGTRLPSWSWGAQGCGKSVALEQEHAGLLEAGLPVTFLHLGRDVFGVTSAGPRLQRILRTGVGAGERFVLLDGLDEGLSDVPASTRHSCTICGS
ncbi:hypothetical protein [Streptomyces mirabilis]|uniref:hypothetical protein n=1 Tax=Streptomyces mirabilis TaxID=68239 RepID=UPI003327CD4A